MKHKFDLGDVVECAFTGEVEGVPVVVRKRLFVQGVAVGIEGRALYFNYHVCENDPLAYESGGKVYSKVESELIELEPVVQETERANRKFVSPAPNQIDQMELAKIIKAAHYARCAAKMPQCASSGTSTTGGSGDIVMPGDPRY